NGQYWETHLWTGNNFTSAT
ncbi:rCG23446, partial [Rattus norvegicus]